MRREDLTQRFKRNNIWYSKNYICCKKVMTDLHWHDAFEILYVRRGIARQQINKSRFVIVPGDVVIIRAGDVHFTESLSDSGCDIDYVQFTAKLLPDSESILSAVSSRVIRHEKNEIEALFDRLERLKESETLGKELLVTGLVYMLCGTVINLGGFQEQACSSVVRKICAYIEESSDIKLSSVSAHFNYSMEHVSRLFRKELGISYRDYCNSIKMKRAKNLMRNAELGISEVALTLGYSDESSFIRAFKRTYGITPHSFRLLESEAEPFTSVSCLKTSST